MSVKHTQQNEAHVKALMIKYVGYDVVFIIIQNGNWKICKVKLEYHFEIDGYL